MNNKILLGSYSMDTTLLDYLSESGCFIEIVDRNGVYVYCSKNNEIYDYLEYDVIGKHYEDVYQKSSSGGPDNPSILKKTLEAGKPLKNVFWSYKDFRGQEYHWLIDTVPILIQQELVGAIAISKPFQGIKNIVERVTPAAVESFMPHNNSKKKMFTFEDIIHKSAVMSDLIKNTKRIANSASSVLITGETGTGKELFAQSIHSASQRKDKPFVAINCSAIPDALLESTLFGTTKGAFTGSYEKKGLFEEANNGTLFLDELNSMNIDLQAKILRVLETKKIRRVGANNEVSVDVRIVSAINVDPFDCMKHGTLRKDLFYRIAIVSVELPPLRGRREDITLLCEYYIARYNQIYGKSVLDLNKNVNQLFQQYQWPGNVRELQHIIEHAMNIVNDDEYVLRKIHLPYYFVKELDIPQSDGTCLENNYKTARTKAFEECEKKFVQSYIIPAIRANGGNISKTADMVEMSRRQLHNLIKKYGSESLR